MKYNVAIVSSLTDCLAVKYVDSHQNALLKNDGDIVKISNVAADTIRTALRAYKRVYLPKNVPGELSHNDIIIVETDGLEKDKMIFLSKIYNTMDYQLFMFSAIDFFEYLTLFNRMTSLGYFITNENREEKYIEIIETGDEDLISLLEAYLEKKDKLDSISLTYNKIKYFETSVNSCNTPEEMQKIKDEFDGVV